VTASAPVATVALAGGGTAALAAGATPLPVTACAAVGAGLAALSHGTCNLALGEEPRRAAEAKPSREITEALPPQRSADRRPRLATKESVEVDARGAHDELSRMAKEMAAREGGADDGAMGQSADPGEESPNDDEKERRGVVQGDKNDIRKPTADDPELKRVIDDLFQSSDRYSGGTAGAVRREAMTRLQTGGRWHAQKAQDNINRLNRLLRTRHMSPRDRATAEAMRSDLQNALSALARAGAP
jgi:hypothetical protein